MKVINIAAVGHEDKRQRWSSYSGITLHRSCPQKWNYRYVRKIEPIPGPTSRVEADFGTLWHAMRAIEAIGRGRALGSLKYAPDTLSVPEGLTITGQDLGVGKISADTTQDQLVAAVYVWWDKMDHERRELFEKLLGADLPSRLESLEHGWRQQWAEDRKHEQPLAVELEWKTRLPQVVKTGPDGSQGTLESDTILIGYVDEVYYDTRRSFVVTRDHKTHKALQTHTTEDDLMESQNQIYSWGAAAVVESWGLGPIRATGYDRVRSAGPKSPQLTAQGKLSKSVTDYDLQTYLDWVGEGIPWGDPTQVYASGKNKGQPKPHGVYQVDPKVVAELSAPSESSKWFQRTLTPVNQNVQRSHLLEAVRSAREIAGTREWIAETGGEAGRNFGYGCKFCDFAKLCRAEMLGGVGGEYELAEFGLRSRARVAR